MAKKFRSVKKSRKNTSGRKSKAASEAAKRVVNGKARLKGKMTSKSKTKPKKKKQSDPNLKNGVSFKAKPLAAREARVLPESYHTRKGLTLRKLLRNTPALFVNNSEYVKILDVKKVKTKTGMPAYVGKLLTVNDPVTSNNEHTRKTVHVIGLDKTDMGQPAYDKPVNRHKKVMIQCNCEAYTFYGFEYANAYHGAARIIYGNGQPPMFTNPGLSYGCCKHAYKLGLELVKREL